MTGLLEAVRQVRQAQLQTGKPLAIVLAGHNGSGKSTMWRERLSGELQMPLVNADRLMLSVLPEPNSENRLPDWAQTLRDTHEGWMRVAQQGVQAFVAQAMAARVPFAMETVFSHWHEQADGSVESKIDLIRDMQAEGYFVLLFFVGLMSAELSILRVRTRVAEGGHDVPEERLRARFPRTQHAIGRAVFVADAAILADNSREPEYAFTVCRVQLASDELFDVRVDGTPAAAIQRWLDVVSPRPPQP